MKNRIQSTEYINKVLLTAHSLQAFGGGVLLFLLLALCLLSLLPKSGCSRAGRRKEGKRKRALFLLYFSEKSPFPLLFRRREVFFLSSGQSLQKGRDPPLPPPFANLGVPSKRESGGGDQRGWLLLRGDSEGRREKTGKQSSFPPLLRSHSRTVPNLSLCHGGDKKGKK